MQHRNPNLTISVPPSSPASPTNVSSPSKNSDENIFRSRRKLIFLVLFALGSLLLLRVILFPSESSSSSSSSGGNGKKGTPSHPLHHASFHHQVSFRAHAAESIHVTIPKNFHLPGHDSNNYDNNNNNNNNNNNEDHHEKKEIVNDQQGNIHLLRNDHFLDLSEKTSGGDDDGDNKNKKNKKKKQPKLGMKGERLSSPYFNNFKHRNKKKHFSRGGGSAGKRYEGKRMFDDISDPVERNEKRRLKVREEFQWAWSSYKSVSWGWDELHPVTRKGRSWTDTGRGFAMTIFDSLDTLYLMNLTKEFNDAVTFLDSEFDLYQNHGCSTFEATIRLLGGTLSSFELSGDRRLLRLAEKVGWILISGLDTGSGMLHDHINFRTKAGTSMGWLNGDNLVGEIGTLQLEFRTLSYHLNDPLFDMKVTHLMSILKSHCKRHGFCCPAMFNQQSGRPASNAFTLGGMSDSYYEYVVKQYVLTGGVEDSYEKMSSVMLRTIKDNYIIQEETKEGYKISFPGTWDGTIGNRAAGGTLEHLACFSGGMFALGALSLKSLPKYERDEFIQIGADITETCKNMYAAQGSGLAPEEVEISKYNAFSVTKNEYRLRPETVESLFYMYRVTRDEIYRDWAWEIFDSIMKMCRVSWGGYCGLIDVGVEHLPKDIESTHSFSLWDDLQQSYFMAETMKYIYLIFCDPDFVNLEEWVFNTEAHPVRIRQRDPRDIWYDYYKKHGSPRWTAPKLQDVDPFYNELSGEYVNGYQPYNN